MAAACRERLTHRKWKSAWPRRPAANPQAPPEPGAAASAHPPMSSPSKAQAADVHYRIAPADLHPHLFTVPPTLPARPSVSRRGDGAPPRSGAGAVVAGMDPGQFPDPRVLQELAGARGQTGPASGRADPVGQAPPADL